MCVGDRVMWHMFNVGNEFDVHTVYFHGHTFHKYGVNSDAEELSPALSNSVIMDIDNPGRSCLLVVFSEFVCICLCTCVYLGAGVCMCR